MGCVFFDKSEPVLKVDSFTDEGKMAWAKACDLEAEFKVLLASYSKHNIHPEEYIASSDLLTSHKNRLFYHLLHQHRQPRFCLNNAEGKHRHLAYCCLATGCFIDPNTGSISSKTDLTYPHFTQNGIITIKTEMHGLRIPHPLLNLTIYSMDLLSVTPFKSVQLWNSITFLLHLKRSPQRKSCLL